MRRDHALLSLLYVAASLEPLASAGYSNLINDFVDPGFLLSDTFDTVTVNAQETIIQWAEMLNAEGPWAVTSTKNVTAPSGDPHDYLSWAPYAWPNCTAAGNTTELTDEEIWSQCTYDTRDGEFNPDVRFVNNTGAFGALADAVFYDVMAWRITGKDYYAANASGFINAWFLDSDTAMNPNLNYGQVTRGPETGSTGTHTGVLDLKCMSKIASGILALRQGNAPSWTSDMDTAMKTWTTAYISWMETNSLALQEAASENNHGSFYFVQLASLYLIADDKNGTLNATQFYFDHAYQQQINSTGEQPYEAIRTRPYHYRCYNLVAMLSNAKLSAYAGKDQWNTATAYGATIKNALDYTMTVEPGDDQANELWLPVAAGAYAYGNGGDIYGSFLLEKNPAFGADPYFFWYRPSVNAAAWDSDAEKNMPASNSTTSGDRSAGVAKGQARGELALVRVGITVVLAGLLLS